MSDAIKVAVRIRPLVESEIQRGCLSCVDTAKDSPQVIVQSHRQFTFNYVFDKDSSQQDVYEAAVSGLVQQLFKGYNVTVLAYGQTGSGKTHTMGSTHVSNEESGVIPRAIQDIFQHTEENSDWEYNVNVSFMELYKEQFFDLLAPERSIVEIREDTKGICIPGLTEVNVNKAETTLNCLKTGSAGRVTGSTAMNSQSSRSHAIFTITINQQKIGDPHSATKAKFHLVDLAGSERSKKTGAEGDRFKEGVTINTGLLALGNVIAALGDGGRVPSYRNSKLTRLLQDSLGGNSLTLMIACISPADYNILETVNTLRYADRARHIKNKPVINQDPASAEIAALKMKVIQLQLQLAGQGAPSAADTFTENIHPLDDQTQLEIKQLEAKLRSLREKYNEVLVENADMRDRMLLAESARDRMKERVNELESEMTLKFSEFETVRIPDDAKGCYNTLKKSFSEKFFNIVEEQNRCDEEQKKHESLNHPLDNSSTDMDSENDNDLKQLDEHQEKHTNIQTELNRELREVSKQLMLKEQRWEQYSKTNFIAAETFKESLALKIQYEKQITHLEKEKIDLMNSIKQLQEANKDADAKIKQSELSKKNNEIDILHKKLAEQAKIVKQKELAEKKVEELRREITNMKQTKVRLIKQMKTESDQWKAWRLSRERETAQLRDQARKRANEMARMQVMHDKQQNVSKRKLEQAVAANKRLKEAIAKQKAVRGVRDLRGNKEQVQELVSHEVEVLVSTVDAERSLQLLLEDRAALTAEFNALKRLTTDAAMTQRIASIEQEIDLRSAQISDLQQKLVDSDLEKRNKNKWDAVGSMADAKIALSHAVRLAADIRREAMKREAAQLEAQQNVVAEQQKIQENLQKAEQAAKTLKQELAKEREAYHLELLKLEKEHQDALEAFLNNKENKLRKKDEEVSCLQNRLDTILSVTITPKQKKKRRSVHREFEDLNLSADGTYDFDDEIADPSWRQTPVGQRLAALRTARSSKNISMNPPLARKRNTMGESLIKCGCLSKCETARCICHKANAICGDHCSCNPLKCQYKRSASSLSIDNSSLNQTYVKDDSTIAKKRKTSIE